MYYCKYSGKHAFTIDADITKLPRRRTDSARIADLDKHNVKLYTQPGGMKLIKRCDLHAVCMIMHGVVVWGCVEVWPDGCLL